MDWMSLIFNPPSHSFFHFRGNIDLLTCVAKIRIPKIIEDVKSPATFTSPVLDK